MTTNCDHCRKEGATKRCSKCQKVFYCSRDCQIAGWKQGHKKVCSPWDTLAVMPAGGGGTFVVAAGCYKDFLVVVRGMEGNQKAECWTLNTQSKEWTKRKNLPISFRNSATGVVVQQYMYIFVYTAAEIRTFRLNLENINSSKWEERAALSGMRMEVSLASDDHNNCIYLSGGQQLTDPQNTASPLIPLSTVARYDSAKNKWNPNWSTMPTPRFSHSSAIVQDRLYILGGRNEQHDITEQWEADPTRKVPICNLTNNTWSWASSLLPSPNADSVAVVWKDRFVITFPGMSQGSMVLDTQTEGWAFSSTIVMDPMRVQPRATVLPDGKLVLVGGMNPFSGFSSVKWVDEIHTIDLDQLIQSAKTK